MHAESLNVFLLVYKMEVYYNPIHVVTSTFVPFLAERVSLGKEPLMQTWRCTNKLSQCMLQSYNSPGSQWEGEMEGSCALVVQAKPEVLETVH